MSDDEYLMTSRKRRSNAGSRLKQLINMESEAVQSTVSLFVNEDDESVNLLFQEDEDDQEFMESEEEDEEEDEEEENKEEGEGEGVDDQDDKEKTEDPNGESKEASVDILETEDGIDDSENSEVEQVDSDEVLSDSDISLSDTDEEEGERELETEERRKKRKQTLQSRLIPKIKKFKTADSKPKNVKPKKVVTSDSLLSAKRSSTRASAIENKEALVQKLKLDEKRRAALTPVVREKQRELTQEEKLAEAVETEKANILSLELFQQQEIVKKERQKLLLQLRKPKLVNVVSFLSQEQLITPTQEIENARKLYQMITSRSRKKHIKKLKQLFEMDLDKYPGEIDKDLPYYKEEQRLKALSEAKEKESNTEHSNGVEGEAKSSNELLENGKPSNSSEHMSSLKEEPAAQAITEPEASSEVDEPKGENGTKPTTEIASTDENSESKDDISEKKLVKNVTFADNVKGPEAIEDSEEPSVNTDTLHETSKEPQDEVKEETEEKKEIFEGPAQRIAKNTISLGNFPIEKLQDDEEIMSIIFGEQSLLPAPRRFKDLKTILKIGNVNNPYAKVRVERDPMLVPATDLTTDDAMFEELNRLPKLGIRQEIIEEVIEEDTNDAAIQLKTEAPVGLYLPNGNKKTCLITGTEVKYFDPSLGVPYSDVETFKFLKSIENGNIPWYSMDSSYNDTGTTEIYLGSRDNTFRSARGVPQGFDG